MQELRAALSKQKYQFGLKDFSQLSSTVLAVGLDKKSGQYLLLHLGSGAAQAYYRDGSERILSGASLQTGVLCRGTWLTTSEDAVSHLTIRFGTTDKTKRLVLVTDGGDVFCGGRRIALPMNRLMRSFPAEEVFDYLQQIPPQPADSGYIIIDFPESAAELRNTNL